MPKYFDHESSEESDEDDYEYKYITEEEAMEEAKPKPPSTIIEKILASREAKGKVEYLIKWKVNL